MGWEGIGTLLGKVANQFQGRIERLKNEKSKLEEEKKTLEGKNYDINKPEDRKKMERYSAIVSRIGVINGLLGVKAQD